MLTPERLPAPTLEHLMYPWPLHCGRCGHLATQHWPGPACRECACHMDPVCYQCGRLTSTHVLPDQLP